MAAEIMMLIVGLFCIGFFGHFLVHASIRLAKMFRVSEVFIGLTIVAAGTSAPEIAVSVSAAINGEGEISVGNVIGSNIFNLGFILGIVALISPQKIAKKMVYRDGMVLLGSTLLVFLAMVNQFIGRIEGAILLCSLVAYNIYLWKKKDIPEEEESSSGQHGNWTDIPLFFGSLLGLVFFADIVVDSAVTIARTFGISEWAIGATIVAAGTSLPEIATSVIATLRGKYGLSVGNVVGSDIFNVFGIIGISAVIAPLSLESQTIGFLPDNLFSVILLVLTIGLTLVFMRTGWRISRVEGGILLGIALIRMILELYLGSS